MRRGSEQTCSHWLHPLDFSKSHSFLVQQVVSLTNLMNGRIVVRKKKCFIEDNKRFWFVRASRADMTHNLFQVWMTAWIFEERARSQSPVMSDQICHIFANAPQNSSNVDESRACSKVLETNVGLDLFLISTDATRVLIIDWCVCKSQNKCPACVWKIFTFAVIIVLVDEEKKKTTTALRAVWQWQCWVPIGLLTEVPAACGL